jgi:bifunctional DNase/RNase
MIGIFEATSIDRCVKGVPSPRPLTHDAWAATIEALGAHVESVSIAELQDHTYFTSLRLKRGDERIDVDVRPSDGVVVALLSGAPIHIPEPLLDSVTGP